MISDPFKTKKSSLSPTHSIKLGILVSHPIQYFVSVYKEIEKYSEIDLTVVYRTRVGLEPYYDKQFGQIVQWDVPLLEQYKSHFLSSKTSLGGIELSIIRTLLSKRFDVLILHGYNSITNIVAIFLAKILAIKIILRGDSKLDVNSGAESPRKKLLKKAIKFVLFYFFDAFLAIGKNNKDYYLSHAVKSNKIYFSPFSVNNDFFYSCDDSKLNRRMSYRKECGVPDDALVILFSSKLTVRKRAADLIQSYAKLMSRFSNVWLIVAGDGEQRLMLEGMVKRLNLTQVKFVGFQNQSHLPHLYAASDCFVLPAQSEPWGLIVNEVMAAGLPVIVSDEVGCAADLVKGQNTGIIYPCGDLNALTNALSTVLLSSQLREIQGKNALKLIKHWSPEVSAALTLDAVRHVFKH